jgi:hypothetical protein
LVIIFTGFIGSLIYYFLIKREVMEAKVLLISLVLALVIGFGMLILVTGLFQPTIEFSLFLGIPSGIVSGVIVFVIAYWWLGKKQDMLNHPKKLIGLVFALIIVVWLLVKVLPIVLT